jgi:hypothetical protein
MIVCIVSKKGPLHSGYDEESIDATTTPQLGGRALVELGCQENAHKEKMRENHPPVPVG